LGVRFSPDARTEAVQPGHDPEAAHPSNGARAAQTKIVEMVRNAPLPERPQAQEGAAGA
jgi:hypothetical protein